MVQVRRFLILIFASSVLACSKTTPTFDLLDESAIPQPKFSGSTTKNLTASSTTVTFTISGECDSKISALQARPVGVANAFSSVGDFTVAAPTINCSSGGTFTLQLKSLTDLGFSPLTEGSVYEIQLKGMTSAGLSRASTIRITYSRGGNTSIWLAAGGLHGNKSGSANNADKAFTATDGTISADLHLSFKNTTRTPTAFPAPGGHYSTDGSVTARFGAASR